MVLISMFMTGTQGLVFVIDSSDRERIDEARTELTRIIQDREMKDALLLVFANKQDIPGALKPEEVSRLLRLNDVAKNHTWKVQPSCAKTGDGIFEGLVCCDSTPKKKDIMLTEYDSNGSAPMSKSHPNKLTKLLFT